MNTTTKTTAQLSRLGLFRRGAAAAAALGAAALPATLPAAARAAPGGEADAVEPGAGAWRTWFTPGGDALRPPAPPAGGDDLAQVRALVGQRDAATLDRIAHWDAGAPPYRWIETATDLLKETPDGRRGRVWAYLAGAMDDATIAAWDAKYAYRRPRPSRAEPALAPAVAVPRSPAYPSEHAAVGAAAAAVLGFFFPDRADALRAAAEEAARSRVLAGVQYPSDAAAGLELGRRVADFALARARGDGADTPWDGVVPDGPDRWRGQNPVGVTDRYIAPFVLAAADRLRPPPPPAPGSAESAAELAELTGLQRTPRMVGLALGHQYSYNGASGFDVAALRHVDRLVFEGGLQDSPRAARAYALVAVAYADAWIATQDAKYHYWAPRPAQLDPSLTTVFPTPNHPSYPSNRAAIARAPAVVLGHLFPRDAERFRQEAEQAAESAVWAGIHFRSDVESSKAMGEAIGRLVIARDQR
jgi:membrane-associated phospholipid phosphatase